MTTKIGRPSTKTPEREELALRAVARGLTAREIKGLEDGTPGYTAIQTWADNDPDFAARLARANKGKAASLIAEAQEIIDTVDVDCKAGNARVSKAREQVGLRRYIASCLDRQAWGDSIKLDVQGKVEILQAFVDLSPRTVDDTEVVTEVLPHVDVPDGADG